MKLSKEQVDKVITYLNAKADSAGIVCPFCKHKEWLISDAIFEAREFTHGDLVVGGISILPFVTISCKNCGNTMFLNAIQVGILDSTHNAEEKK